MARDGRGGCGSDGPHRRVLAYGSSMGGYAGLRFGKMIGATSALAISPQYSMQRDRAGFDTRWAKTVNRIRWRPELAGPLPADLHAVIVYDPAHAFDRRHVELIAGEMVRGGSPCPSPGIRPAPISANAACSARWRSLSSRARPTSPRCCARHAITVEARPPISSHSPVQSGLAIRNAPSPSARCALDLNPTAHFTWVTLAEQLRFAGRIEEALAALERAVALTKEHPEMLRVLSNAL